MLLPHLLRAAGPVIYVGFIFLCGSILLLSIFIPDLREGLRSHPLRTVLAQATPWMYPLACWALFSYAARHDRQIEQQLRANGVTASATVTAVRDIVIGKKIFSVLSVDLRVTPPEAQPFDAELAIDPTESPVGAPSPGRDVRVLYDPRDRSRLIIVK